MKIKKNEFETTPSWLLYPETCIEKVIYPFVPMICSRNLKVHFCRKT